MELIKKYFEIRKKIKQRVLAFYGLLLIIVAIISIYHFTLKIPLDYQHANMGTQDSRYSFGRWNNQVYWKHNSVFSDYVNLSADRETFQVLDQTLAYDKDFIYFDQKPFSISSDQFEQFLFVRCKDNPIYLISDINNNVYEIDGWHESWNEESLTSKMYINNADVPDVNPLVYELESRCVKVLER